MVSSSEYVCIYASGISLLSTSILSCAYTHEVIIIVSMDTVGDEEYYFLMYACCFSPILTYNSFDNSIPFL